MKNNRRHFFKNIGTIGVSLAAGKTLSPVSWEKFVLKDKANLPVVNAWQNQWNSKIQADRDI